MKQFSKGIENYFLVSRHGEISRKGNFLTFTSDNRIYPFASRRAGTSVKNIIAFVKRQNWRTKKLLFGHRAVLCCCV